MGTSAAIGIQNEDSTVIGVYCNFDGYLDYVGKLLHENYNTEEKVRKLISYGNISSLGMSVGEKHNFDDRSLNETTYYGRDRGEKNQKPKKFSDLYKFVEHYGASYSYLFADGQWYVIDGLDAQMSLEEAFECEEN